MPITKSEVRKAQEKWGRAIVRIGRAYSAGEDVAAIALKKIDRLYDYDEGTVLFKPTKCEHRQFRLTKDGALSYFVGHELAKSQVNQPDFPEDGGFAIAPYVSVQFLEADIIPGDQALAMGNYIFTQPNGLSTQVEYTFGYVRRDGKIKINVHHSSLPFQNKKCTCDS